MSELNSNSFRKFNKFLKVSNSPYFPDIVYKDHTRNIIVDIEIDEPYSKSGKPIHYQENIEDHQRNKYFQKCGWYIIRFSESQIEKDSLTCAWIVNELINRIEKKTLDLKSFYELKEYKTILEPRWDKKTSEQYIKEKKRDFYDYEEIAISINPLTQIDTYENEEHFFNYIINKHLPTLDRTVQMVYIPTEIFIKRQVKNNENVIFIKFIHSKLLMIKDGKYNWAYKSAKNYYKICYNTQNELYNLLIEIKSQNKINKIRSTFENIYSPFHGIIFYGPSEKYSMQELSWKQYL